MPVLRRGIVLATGLAGAIAASQAPEFAQQYRQRLGGAIEELQSVVSHFDNDAARNGLSRNEALARYDASNDGFFQDRGLSMRQAIDRYESLLAQAARFGSMPELARPLALARGYDDTLLKGAWRDFEPAVPVTPHGLVWTAAGFGVGAMLIMLLARLLRFRPRTRPSKEAG